MILACCLDAGLFDAVLLGIAVGWVVPTIQQLRKKRQPKPCKKCNEKETDNDRQ